MSTTLTSRLNRLKLKCCAGRQQALSCQKQGAAGDSSLVAAGSLLLDAAFSRLLCLAPCNYMEAHHVEHRGPYKNVLF
jgi:hypothetical protein